MHGFELPRKYTNIYVELGHPLALINKFLLHNLGDVNDDSSGVLDRDHPKPIPNLKEMIMSRERSG